MSAEASEGSVGSVDAIALVDQILHAAIQRQASDIHIEPTAVDVEVRLRVDGLLEVHSHHDSATGRMLVSRLMVMAHLLTYRLDIPQEGRLQMNIPGSDSPRELRLAIIPTTHGLRAAVRLPAELLQPRSLDELDLPPGVLSGLKEFSATDSGMLLVTGPAGSGKTTTIYALLEHIVRTCPGQSIISLEDPVERNIPGVTQIEISPFGQLTYERALRSILRQDPQVLMLGEIRDAMTASLAVQAALSGHRLICTLHASTPGGAISRLLEMGLEPYRITSALWGAMAQRLVRKLNPPAAANEPRYRGRIPVAELVRISAGLRTAILAQADTAELQRIAGDQAGYSTMRQTADALVARGLTDTDEVDRVLGPKTNPGSHA